MLQPESFEAESRKVILNHVLVVDMKDLKFRVRKFYETDRGIVPDKSDTTLDVMDLLQLAIEGVMVFFLTEQLAEKWRNTVGVALPPDIEEVKYE